MAVLELLASQRVKFDSSQVAAGALTSEQVSTLTQQAAADTYLEAARTSLIDDELLRQLAARDGIATPPTPDPWAEAATYVSGDAAHRVRYVRFGLATTSAAPTSPNPSPSPSASRSPSASPSPEPATASPTPNPTASPSAGQSAAPTASPGSSQSPAPNVWPTASAANVAAATSSVQAALAADTPIETIVARLHDAGWKVFGVDATVSSQGVPADSSVDLDPVVAAATLTATPGQIVGPTTDAYGRVALGKVLDPPPAGPLAQRLPAFAWEANVDQSALQDWANGQALEAAVRDHLVAGWRQGVTEAHFREVVVGPAPDSSATGGPWVELSQLLVDRLKGIPPSSIPAAPSGVSMAADALARTFSSMPVAERPGLFRSLAAAANSAPGASTATSSGEIGWYTKDTVTAELGKAVFADATRSGDVVGPISTAMGPMLYLVEARYPGALDDRSKIALAQVRNQATPDLTTYTQLYSPDDAPLASDAGWRAQPEFGPDEAVAKALFDTPTGILSDPFVLDGKLGMAIVIERRTAAPDERLMARLRLDGYEAWFGSEYSKAKIDRSDQPLPELEPSASPSPASTPGVEVPSAPELETPNLPVVPGQPEATPVPTDAMGLPVLP
jgi:hypothetical protein